MRKLVAIDLDVGRWLFRPAVNAVLACDVPAPVDGYMNTHDPFPHSKITPPAYSSFGFRPPILVKPSRPGDVFHPECMEPLERCSACFSSLPKTMSR